MRLYKCFTTKQEQKAWEKLQKDDSENFRVCMRMTAKQLEEDMCMQKGTLDAFHFATVYTYDK